MNNNNNNKRSPGLKSLNNSTTDGTMERTDGKMERTDGTESAEKKAPLKPVIQSQATMKENMIFSKLVTYELTHFGTAPGIVYTRSYSHSVHRNSVLDYYHKVYLLFNYSLQKLHINVTIMITSIQTKLSETQFKRNFGKC